MLMAGLVVAGAGAVLARSVGSLMLPLVFVAIGAPFIALALGNHGQLMFNASSGSGKIFAGVFGGCFVIAGLIWGVFAAREITGVSGGSLLGGLLAAVVGVGAAFAIACGVSTAIGKTTAPSSVHVAPGVTVLSAAAERARQISLCKDLVAGEHLIGAHDRASLTAECRTNWKAAEHQLPAAAKRGALAYAADAVQAADPAGRLRGRTSHLGRVDPRRRARRRLRKPRDEQPGRRTEEPPGATLPADRQGAGPRGGTAAGARSLRQVVARQAGRSATFPPSASRTSACVANRSKRP